MSNPSPPPSQHNGNPVIMSHNHDTLGLILMFVICLLLIALLWRFARWNQAAPN
jgi:hypothetical protein